MKNGSRLPYFAGFHGDGVVYRKNDRGRPQRPVKITTKAPGKGVYDSLPLFSWTPPMEIMLSGDSPMEGIAYWSGLLPKSADFCGPVIFSFYPSDGIAIPLFVGYNPLRWRRVVAVF